MIGIPKLLSVESVRTIYYLLYSYYGNSVISSTDENRFKYQLFTIIFMYGPTWEKRLEIQKTVRGLSESDIMTGSTQIYNHSYNPSDPPSTQTLEELTTINEQNTQKNKRDKLAAYANLMAILEKDVTKEFIDKFKSLFLVVVQPNRPLLYGTVEQDFNQIPDVNTTEYINCTADTLYGGGFRQRTFTQIYENEAAFLEDYNAE